MPGEAVTNLFAGADPGPITPTAGPVIPGLGSLAPVIGVPPLPGIFGVPGLGFPGPAVTEAALIDLSPQTNTVQNSLTDKFWDFFGPLLGQPAGRIIFQYMPESFTETKQVNWADTDIIGRSEPVVGYRSSGPRIFNITLTLVAGLTPDPVFDVIRPLWLVRSWAYPNYTDTKVPNTPPKLLFVIGSWMIQQVILLRYDIKYTAPWARVHLGRLFAGLDLKMILGSDLTMPGGGSPFVDSMIPYLVEINLTLQEVARVRPPGSIDVARGADRYVQDPGGPPGVQILQTLWSKVGGLLG